MTNLDSILKSRDITLPTKTYLVKAMVFPVVMYWCDSWTIKKAGCQRTEAFFFFFLMVVVYLLFIFFLILFLNFIILYYFCQISKWICHRYTRIPHPEPSTRPAASLNPQPASHNAPRQDLLPRPPPANLDRIYIPETCPGASRPGHTPSLAVSSSPAKTASGQHHPGSRHKPVPLPGSLFSTLICRRAAGVMTG